MDDDKGKMQDAADPEPRNPATSGITRRGLIGAAGASVVAAALGVAACSQAESPTASQLAETDGNARVNHENPVRVMPASSMAQSLIAALSPVCLASLVGEFAPGELPQDFAMEGLSVTGVFSEDGRASFLKMVDAVKPDLVVDVGRYEGSRASALVSLQDESGVPCFSANLNEMPLSEVAKTLAELTGIEDCSGVVSTLEDIEDDLDAVSNIPASESLGVYVGGGEDGLLAYGSGTVEDRMVKSSGAMPFVAAGAETGSSYVEDTVFLADYSPDIVFLLDRAASQDYVEEGGVTSLWRVVRAGRLGCVFLGLAGGCAWLGEMSPFAKVTVGAAWLAALLYPDKVSAEKDSVVTNFYETLFGAVPQMDPMASSGAALLEDGLPVNKAELDAKDQASREERDQDAQAVANGIQAANNPDNYTDEELRQIYDALCEGYNVEPTDEQWEQFLAEIRK